MDLAELKFVVITDDLEKAATRIKELGTEVSKLNKPMKDLTTESIKNNKELSKAEEAAAKAALAQVKLQQAQEKSVDTASKSVSVLERQNLILEYMAQGNSKGQASILATAKAAGALDGDMLALNQTLKTQRTLIGGDPFDKSIGLMQKLQNEYKTTLEVTTLFNRNLGLTEKQMIDLAREKQRLIALYGIEGRDIKELAGEYDELIRKSVMLNQANDTRTNTMRQQVKTQNDAAKAEQYIANEMDRVNRLTESNGTITSGTNSKLMKFEAALKQTGMSASAQTAALEKYKESLLSIQKASGNRQVDYLSRALGPQITDIGVGLATGQSPMMVLLQQGGQLRDQFALAGIAGKDMGDMLVKSAGGMVTSIKDVSLAVGQVFVKSIMGVGTAVVDGIISPFKRLSEARAALKQLDEGLISNLRYARLMEVASGRMYQSLISFGKVGATAAVAGLVMLGKGLYDVIKEQDAMTVQLVSTGASLGVNTTAAISYANSLNDIGITTGSALKVMQSMAKEGGFVAGEINMIVTSANNLKLAGVAVEDTVKQFAKLKEKPVEALLEIAKSTGMVSPEITKLVYQLVEQGKTSEAAAIAMKAYADVTVQQKDRLKTELSDFALFMKSLSSNVGEFFDDVFRGLWRKTSPSEALKREIADLENTIKMGTEASPATRAKNDATLIALKEQLRLTKQASDADQTRLSDQARNARLYQDFIKDNTAFATNQMKREKELAEAKTRNDQLIAAGTITKAQAETQYQNIREKYKDPKPETDKFANALETAKKFYQGQVGAVDELTKSEIALNKVRESKEYKGFTADQKKQIDALYEQASANEKLVKSEKDKVIQMAAIEGLTSKASNFGKEYYTTLKQLDNAYVDGNISLEKYIELLNLLYKTTPEAKRRLSVETENAKIMAGLNVERTAVADQYGGDFKTSDQKAAIKNLSDYRKKIADADAQYTKQLSDAGKNITAEETAMYKAQADEKKALADDVYKREQYLLSDGYKRQQAYATAFEDIFKGMGDAIIDFALTGKTSFGDLTKSILTNLLKMEMQMQMSSIYKNMGGVGGIVGAISGNGFNVSTASTYGTNVGSQQTSMLAAQEAGMFPFAKGGTFTNSIVDSPTMFKFAKGTGLMGEAGPEAIMPLRRGADGSLGVTAAGSSSNVQVVVNNNGSSTASAKETTDSRGNRRIEVTIGDMIAAEVNRKGSGINQTIMNNTGSKNQIVRR